MFLYAHCIYMALISLRSRELICGYGSAHSEGGGGGFFSIFFFPNLLFLLIWLTRYIKHIKERCEKKMLSGIY